MPEQRRPYRNASRIWILGIYKCSRRKYSTDRVRPTGLKNNGETGHEQGQKEEQWHSLALERLQALSLAQNRWNTTLPASGAIALHAVKHQISQDLGHWPGTTPTDCYSLRRFS